MDNAQENIEGKIARSEVKYAPFYRSFYQVSRNLCDTDRLALYDAVNAFCFEGVYPCFQDEKAFPGLEKRELIENCFTIMAPIMESTMKKMVGGSKGGRPKKGK